MTDQVREYAFDVNLAAAIRVKATSEAEARQMLMGCIDATTANLGAWPNGDPILAEVSLIDPEHDALFEIDGEAVSDHTREFLVLSTAHMTSETAAKLNAIGSDIKRLPFAGGVTGYGWIAYCHDENCDVDEYRIPADLFSLMQYGRSVGAEYLLLDCDAEPIDGLPVYDGDDDAADEWGGTGPCPKCQGDDCDPEGGCVHDE